MVWLGFPDRVAAKFCLAEGSGENAVVFVVSAPSNLGLKPPELSSVPGTCRAPEALREAGLWARLGLTPRLDLGVVLPGRYRDDAVPGSRRLRNHDAIVDHSLRLANRLASAQADTQILVLGGDCSILVGIGVCLKRRGRFGLVHIDGHTDFRNPWNSQQCASLAGEDLAAVVGHHWASIADIEGLAPYFEPADVVHVGCRSDDEWMKQVLEAGVTVVPAEAVNRDYQSAGEVITGVIGRSGLDGYWLHLDVDVLDPKFLSAVDSPDPGGIDPRTLQYLLTDLWPGSAGLDVTVFDPDLDPGGEQARLLVEIIGAGITGSTA